MPRWLYVHVTSTNSSKCKAQIHAEFYRRLESYFTGLIPDWVESGAPLFLTRSELDYLAEVNAILEAQIPVWRGAELVSRCAYNWGNHMLCAGFRYLHNNKSYWLRKISDNRRFLSNCGRHIPYQVVSVICIHHSYF